MQESKSASKQISLNQAILSIVIGVVLVVVISSLLYFFLLYRQQEGDSLANIENDLYFNNRDQAIFLAREEIAKMNNQSQSESFWLRYALASNLFLRDNPNDRQEAIALMRQVAEDKMLVGYMRAIAVNTIIWFSTLDKTLADTTEFPYYIESDEVSSVDPKYPEIVAEANSIEGDSTASRMTLTRILAQFSTELAPTTFANMYLASWYTEVVLGSSVHDDGQARSKEDLVALIDDFLEEGDIQHEADQAYENKTKTLDHIEHLLWKGIILGKVAVAGGQAPVPFEDPFREALETLASVERPQSNVNPPSEPFIHFYYAGYLDKLYGEERRADVMLHIESLLRALNEGPQDQGPASFPALVRTTLEAPKGNETKGTLLVSEFITRLAELSPEFKAFVDVQAEIASSSVSQ